MVATVMSVTTAPKAPAPAAAGAAAPPTAGATVGVGASWKTATVGKILAGRAATTGIRPGIVARVNVAITLTSALPIPITHHHHIRSRRSQAAPTATAPGVVPGLPPGAVAVPLLPGAVAAMHGAAIHGATENRKRMPAAMKPIMETMVETMVVTLPKTNT